LAFGLAVLSALRFAVALFTARAASRALDIRVGAATGHSTVALRFVEAAGPALDLGAGSVLSRADFSLLPRCKSVWLRGTGCDQNRGS
jgi:hypothetical protein